MASKNQRNFKSLGFVFCLAFGLVASGQPQSPLGYSVATPCPINPADGTTTPSAQATRRQKTIAWEACQRTNTVVRIELSLRAAIELGLGHNLGSVEANQTSADVRAERLRHFPRYSRNLQLRDARVTKPQLQRLA